MKKAGFIDGLADMIETGPVKETQSGCAGWVTPKQVKPVRVMVFSESFARAIEGELRLYAEIVRGVRNVDGSPVEEEEEEEE